MENLFGSPSSYFSGLILVPEETVLETVATGVLPDDQPLSKEPADKKGDELKLVWMFLS